MDEWRRLLREIDWNGRNFDWREWFTVIFYFVLIPVGAGTLLYSGSPGLAALTLIYVLLGVFVFVVANRRRLGLPMPEGKPPPQISIRALRLILGGGFVAAALVLLALIWLASR